MGVSNYLFSRSHVAVAIFATMRNFDLPLALNSERRKRSSDRWWRYIYVCVCVWGGCVGVCVSFLSYKDIPLLIHMSRTVQVGCINMNMYLYVYITCRLSLSFTLMNIMIYVLTMHTHVHDIVASENVYYRRFSFDKCFCCTLKQLRYHSFRCR